MANRETQNSSELKLLQLAKKVEDLKITDLWTQIYNRQETYLEEHQELSFSDDIPIDDQIAIIEDVLTINNHNN